MEETPTHIVNVRELKRKKESGGRREVKESIAPWFFYGVIISVVFVILGFINIHFLYIAPLGILIGLLSWGVKKLLNRLNLKDYLK